jgi:predicted nucleic acid-binding protein
VALVYFDSSALVKLVVDEAGSDLAAELWDACDAALASRLAYPEVRAALAAACRNHDLSQDGLDAAEQAWEHYWAAARPVELTAAVERHAGQLARCYALHGADAVHLASECPPPGHPWCAARPRRPLSLPPDPRAARHRGRIAVQVDALLPGRSPGPPRDARQPSGSPRCRPGKCLWYLLSVQARPRDRR